MKRLLNVRAVVLAKAPSGENFFKLHLLSGERSGLYALVRRPSTRKTATPAALPDLFDLASLQLESPSHNEDLHFVRSYELERRHDAIAADYKCLVEASRFFRILAANVNQMLHSDELFQLTCRTLQLFESPARPEIVTFKALFLLFRTEGYPVSERWLAGLPAPERANADALLSLKLDPPEPTALETDTLHRITTHLLDWAKRETDFTIP